MVIHTETIRRQIFSVFEHFMELARKGLSKIGVFLPMALLNQFFYYFTIIPELVACKISTFNLS